MIKIYIGIDPDTVKSGVAVWQSQSGKLIVSALSFFKLFDLLSDFKKCPDGKIEKVIIEAGWLNAKSNFHFKAHQTKAAGERIAKNVGANHETGKKIMEMCEYLGLTYELVVPKKSKTSPEYFEKITGKSVRNQDMIDAAMLVYGR
jgi:hypothetical protein